MTPRLRGRALLRARAALFARQPFCVLCLAEGRTTLPTIRDHVRPLAEGGADDASNEQAVCDVCHTAKTQREARRGRMR